MSKLEKYVSEPDLVVKADVDVDSYKVVQIPLPTEVDQNPIGEDFDPKSLAKPVHEVDEIWEAFKNMSIEDASAFYQMYGYGLVEIESIGYEKFIKANGWTNTDEVLSWKTDGVHIMICLSCHKDFGILELDSGLCEKCKPNFYYDLVGEFDSVLSDGKEGLSPIAYFTLHESFRAMFRRSGDIFEDINNSDFLKTLLIMKCVNDLILILMTKEQSVERVSPHVLHGHMKDQKYKGVPLRNFNDLFNIQVATFDKFYDGKANAYNLVGISYDLAKTITNLAVPD